jgi:hypothetical protein
VFDGQSIYPYFIRGFTEFGVDFLTQFPRSRAIIIRQPCMPRLYYYNQNYEIVFPIPITHRPCQRAADFERLSQFLIARFSFRSKLLASSRTGSYTCALRRWRSYKRLGLPVLDILQGATRSTYYSCRFYESFCNR